MKPVRNQQAEQSSSSAGAAAVPARRGGPPSAVVRYSQQSCAGAVERGGEDRGQSQFSKMDALAT